MTSFVGSKQAGKRSHYRLSGVFGMFPERVNEYSVRLVAGFVVLMTVWYIETWSVLPLVFLTWGFYARVIAGPTFSPVAQLTTRVVTPQLERFLERKGPLVAGRPKRFAQGIGAGLSTVALVLHVMASPSTAVIVVGAITIAASLESIFGFCLGCAVYGRLIQLNILDEGACFGECAN